MAAPASHRRCRTWPRDIPRPPLPQLQLQLPFSPSPTRPGYIPLSASPAQPIHLPQKQTRLQTRNTTTRCRSPPSYDHPSPSTPPATGPQTTPSPQHGPTPRHAARKDQHFLQIRLTA
ncbi:hypothetical protein BC628DRAFT_17637 [Trametes gibbosa]|nr:hypothetical protein BC628DRAFT_17637 [Trametes gibbosa]